jgi:hypothetical protein
MATQKTTKKAAKKTYKSSAKKKTVPSLNKITVEDLAAAHAKTEAAIDRLAAQNEKIAAEFDKRHARMEERHAKTEASIDRLFAAQAKTEAARAKIEAAQAKTEATRAKIEAAQAKTEAKMAENHAKTEVAIQELSAENRLLAADVRKTAALVRELTINMGGINNSFGTLVEIVLIPKIRADINAIGNHTFDKAIVDKKVSALVAGAKRTIGEIDLFLFSDAGNEALIVEIKAQFSVRQVAERLERLEKYRKYEEEAEIKGKTLFGAIAGIYIDPTVKDFALENGLYVIEIHEEEEKIDITKPDTCRTW